MDKGLLDTNYIRVSENNTSKNKLHDW